MSKEDTDDLLYELASLIAAYSNPNMFSDLRDMPDDLRLQELEALKNLMGEIIG
jgi:hypothetical protein